MTERPIDAMSLTITQALGRPRTALDLGCGAGYLGALAKGKGALVVGIDSASDQTTAAKGRLDEVIEADPTSSDAAVALGDRTFDLLILGDVLGRCADKEALIRRMLPRLGDGGHVVLGLSTDAAPAARLGLCELTELVSRSGLELLWTGKAACVGAAGPKGEAKGFAVARKRPEKRKLSLTIGMISMNEEKAVGPVIDEIRRHAPDAEILLVDSSKDKTPEIAAERGARVVRQFPPRGYGPAMDRLLYEATTDVILTLDCDGTYPADRIVEQHRLIEEGADLVNATRTRHRPSAMPFPNFLANRVFAASATVLHGMPTTDLHSGMRAYRTSMLRGMDVDPKGPALPVELFVVPARLGYHWVELEIAYLDRVGTTTLHRFDSTMWTFKRLLRATAGTRSRSERRTIL